MPAHNPSKKPASGSHAARSDAATGAPMAAIAAQAPVKTPVMPAHNPSKKLPSGSHAARSDAATGAPTAAIAAHAPVKTPVMLSDAPVTTAPMRDQRPLHHAAMPAQLS